MAYYRWLEHEAEVASAMLDDGHSYAEIAEELNTLYDHERTDEKVRDAFRKGVIDRLLANAPEDAFQRAPHLKVITNEDGSTSIDGDRPYSTDEMADMFGIDTEEWFPSKIVTNQWAKHFQTKVDWRPNELNIVANNWHELLAEISREAPIVRVPRDFDTSGAMYEMLLYDAHIGAKAWGPETGEDYDLYIACQRYREAFLNLLDRCPPDAGRIVVVVGQDLFHFDTLIQGKGGATAKGTPQDVDTRWQKLFIAVTDMLVRLITYGAQRVPNFDVVVQPGNHDTQTTFYAGAFLQAAFANDERVRVDNTPKPRKYIRHGEVLIGYTHGDREKSSDLYGLMTEEAGIARWREWHRGHRHQEECSEDGTMRIRTITALSGKESWHNEMGYRGIPGARAFLWDREYGIIRQEYYNVPWDKTHSDSLGVVLEERA
jgi:hypothetical protein